MTADLEPTQCGFFGCTYPVGHQDSGVPDFHHSWVALTPPSSQFIQGEVEALALAKEIVGAGGLAWIENEYGSDMGRYDVYWGKRVKFFTREQIEARKGAS